MSHRCFRLLLNVAVLSAAWSVASANWSITEPAGPQTYDNDDDVDTHGISTSHPTARYVNFGYEDATGLHFERRVSVNTQDTGGGMYEWDQTLLAPMGGWQLSVVDEMGNPTADHVVWVQSQSNQNIDDRVDGHTVL